MRICEFQFISSGIDRSVAYKGMYNPFLVILSVAIASLAGCVALKITDRIKQSSISKVKIRWGITGAVTMGVGIWSMHFTGMLAFSLPVKIYYDPTVTMISILPGIIASAIALYFLNANRIGFWRLNLGGVLLGVGIGTMHYTGMAAMITEARMYYDPVIFGLSILVAHILATIALYVKFASSQMKDFGGEQTTVVSAILIGCAVAGMHYTGMKAAVYLPAIGQSISQAAVAGLIDPGGLTFFIILGTVIIMGIIIGSTFVDKYLAKLRMVINKLNQEIHKRELAEKDLYESLQEIKDIKFALDEHSIVAITDSKGIITYANDRFCKISKYSMEELLGQDHRLINSGYHPKEFMRDLWVTISSGKVWHGVIKNKAKDGSAYWVDTSIIPFLDEQGRPYQYVSIRSDVTENKMSALHIETVNDELRKNLKITQSLRDDYDKARRKAEEATKAKSEFLANMSHELRTPMNAIVGFCDLLRKTSLDKKQKEYMGVLHSSGQLLCSVVNGVLDFSKLESGSVVLEEIDFNLRYLVKDVIDIMSVRINKDTVKIYLDVDKDLPQNFKGDPTKLRQVLLNLMSNALKFTSQGEIRVIVGKEQTNPDGGITVQFTVKDTGVGMSQDGLKHVFQPFQQADITTTRKYGGTGLGLAITKSIVEAMGGEIRVKSEEGRGSEFIFSIKLREGESVAQKEIYPISTERLEGLKVLIVDDNHLSREILKKLCVSLKMEVVALEHSGFSALGELNTLHQQNNLPDLIFSDIRMEGMDGFELVEKIRADKKYCDIKIVTVSSEAYDGQANKARAKGFDGYLSKPFNNPELVHVVTTVFGHERKGGAIVTRHMANEIGCKGMKVLIVEDNKPNQMLMEEYAKELGFDSDFADNGQQAIDKLKEGKIYDVILMDLHMPVMGGIEASKIIRKDSTKDVPIITLTAAILDEDRKNAEAAGMNDFLKKPIDVDNLREKIIKYGRLG